VLTNKLQFSASIDRLASRRGHAQVDETCHVWVILNDHEVYDRHEATVPDRGCNSPEVSTGFYPKTNPEEDFPKLIG